jgi:hypothetical protein
VQRGYGLGLSYPLPDLVCVAMRYESGGGRERASRERRGRGEGGTRAAGEGKGSDDRARLTRGIGPRVYGLSRSRSRAKPRAYLLRGAGLGLRV